MSLGTEAVTMLPFVLLLAIGLLGAGSRAGRRMGLDPVESLALGPALVLVVFWQAGFAAFVLKLPMAVVSAAALGLLAVAAVLPARRPERAEWILAGGLLAAFTWMLALQAMIPLYDGGGWAGDWLEHYQRALVFLERLPKETILLDTYLLPARPPAWNVLAAMGMAVAGTGFAAFQILSLFLNLLPILVLPLFVRRWFPGSGWAGMLAGAAFLLLNPAFQRNATYTWTRGLTNYLVLAAVYFYLKGGYGRDRRLTLVAFLAMTTGALAHYSAANYLVALTLHFVATSLRSRGRWMGIVTVGIFSVLLLLPWLGWAWSAFGWDGAFLSNSTVWEGSTLTWSNRLVKDAYNIFHSFIPTGLFTVEFYRSLPQRGFNAAMLFYSNSFPGGLSLAGLVLYGLWAVRRRRSPGGSSPQRGAGFWLPFLGVAFWLGVTTSPGISLWGSANINHQPMLLLAVAFAAGIWTECLTVAEAGCVTALAVTECAVFSFLQISSPGYAALQAGLPAHLSTTYNASLKRTEGLVFLRDRLEAWMPMFAGYYFAVLALLGGVMLRLHPAFGRNRRTPITNRYHSE